MHALYHTRVKLALVVMDAVYYAGGVHEEESCTAIRPSYLVVELVWLLFPHFDILSNRLKRANYFWVQVLNICDLSTCFLLTMLDLVCFNLGVFMRGCSVESELNLFVPFVIM